MVCGFLGGSTVKDSYVGEMGNDESGEWEKWSVEPDGGVGAEDEWRGTPTPQQQSHTQHDVPAPQAHLQHNTARTHSRKAPQYQHHQQIYTTTVSSQYDDTPHLFILNQAGLTTQHSTMGWWHSWKAHLQHSSQP